MVPNPEETSHLPALPSGLLSRSTTDEGAGGGPIKVLQDRSVCGAPLVIGGPPSPSPHTGGRGSSLGPCSKRTDAIVRWSLKAPPPNTAPAGFGFNIGPLGDTNVLSTAPPHVLRAGLGALVRVGVCTCVSWPVSSGTAYREISLTTDVPFEWAPGSPVCPLSPCGRGSLFKWLSLARGWLPMFLSNSRPHRFLASVLPAPGPAQPARVLPTTWAGPARPSAPCTWAGPACTQQGMKSGI